MYISKPVKQNRDRAQGNQKGKELSTKNSWHLMWRSKEHAFLRLSKTWGGRDHARILSDALFCWISNSYFWEGPKRISFTLVPFIFPKDTEECQNTSNYSKALKSQMTDLAATSILLKHEFYHVNPCSRTYSISFLLSDQLVLLSFPFRAQPCATNRNNWITFFLGGERAEGERES